MRILAIIVVLACIGWGGYWFAGSRAMEGALVAWFDDRRAEGWQANFASLNTRGFPNRFDTTFRDLHLADPETGVAWSAPFLQVLSLSYKPHHIIAVLPPRHVFSTPRQTISIASPDTKGSVVFQPSTSLPLDRSQFVAQDVSLSSTADWTLTAERLLLATRRGEGHENTYDVAVEADGLDPGGWLDGVPGALPDEIGELKVDTSIAFDAPWDRHAVEDRRPQPTRIGIRTARAAWGELEMQFAGELDVDGAGTPSGKIAVQARNWREMLDLAVGAGAVPVELAPTFQNVLQALAGMTGNPNHIDATLNFRAGLTFVGPLPIGPAPKIFIR